MPQVIRMAGRWQGGCFAASPPNAQRISTVPQRRRPAAGSPVPAAARGHLAPTGIASAPQHLAARARDSPRSARACRSGFPPNDPRVPSVAVGRTRLRHGRQARAAPRDRHLPRALRRPNIRPRSRACWSCSAASAIER
jgi:hypothetical protein